MVDPDYDRDAVTTLSVEIFKDLFDAMPQLSWTARPDGFIDFYNRGWYEFTGTTFEQAKGWGWEAVHHPEYLPGVREKFKNAIEIGSSFELEFPMRRHDGVFEWFLTKISPLKDETGKVTRWIGINSNIQSLKESQILLQNQERRIATLANALPNFIWSTDRELNVDFFNERWYEYTGLTPNQSLGHGWRQCFSDEMLKKMDIDWQNAIETKTSYSAEQQIRSKDGKYRWFLTKGYPFLDETGEIQSWFGTNTDIHEQKQASELLEKTVATRTRQLELERDKAIAADAAKSAFVTTIGHEIRTPLASVIGLMELLTLTEEKSEFREIAAVALSSSQNLLEILNDLLDASKLNAGKLAIESRDFSLREILNEVYMLHRSNAEKKAISLQISIDDAIPATVLGDELRLRQILNNLVSNAIKFTAAGHVSVACKVGKSNKDEKLAVIFEITDTGIGIAEAEIANLFKPYSQLGSSTSRIYGGTGLGLSICKDLVELMNGRISVESKIGVGSTFWVEIPLLTLSTN